jgi:hypothetical protein
VIFFYQTLLKNRIHLQSRCSFGIYIHYQHMGLRRLSCVNDKNMLIYHCDELKCFPVISLNDASQLLMTYMLVVVGVFRVVGYWMHLVYYIGPSAFHMLEPPLDCYLHPKAIGYLDANLRCYNQILACAISIDIYSTSSRQLVIKLHWVMMCLKWHTRLWNCFKYTLNLHNDTLHNSLSLSLSLWEHMCSISISLLVATFPS